MDGPADAGRASVRFGRDVTGDVAVAEQREFLVTNGIGGYGSGTVAGTITRGYHGLLVASLKPPIDRRIMLVKLDETVAYLGASYDLATNRWGAGTVAPNGCANIESFELEGSVPHWRYACADAVVDKRVWMEHGANTTYVAYTLVSAGEPIRLSIRTIADNRVFHNTGQTAWPAAVQPVDGGVRVVADGTDARPLTISVSAGDVAPAEELYEGFLLPAETARGLNDHDTHVHVATIEATLDVGHTLTVLASAENDPAIAADALARRTERDRDLLVSFEEARPAGADAPAPWVRQLVLAADQFVVDRPSPNQPDGKSVIAGYHWFEDWGRDTMISLPGLALATGRADVAAPILRTFAGAISEGMLPNRFPDAGDEPAYNTIDATLWYFQAIRAYVAETGDTALLADLYPHLQEIVDAHLAGTRFGIHVDPADGLLAGGEEGVQLTWMDAKVGDHVVTPRIGKPVEVNALWFNALTTMAEFAGRLGRPADAYQARADSAAKGFDRFWNDAAGYCFDVLDGPHGHEATLRPNQLLAVSLPVSPLGADRQRLVVDACARALLTSHGLRSLAPSDPAYAGSYGGDSAHRDGAYHQGTVWAWLIGPFVDAHLRVYGDPDATRRLLEPLGDHLGAAGLGSISEIFDGDAPFRPQGCVAQAWSVGETLRALDAIDRFGAAHAAAEH